MFCPKCGQSNPETGKFCRSCGTDLGNVSQALSGAQPPQPAQILNSKGKPINYEGAITKIFSGIGFLAVAIALAFTIGKGWWFWFLIPAFGALGSGVAQYFQLRHSEKNGATFAPVQESLPSQGAALPPAQTEFVSPESRYKTGDLVPPSVTDNTTRHLEMESEDKTKALPKI